MKKLMPTVHTYTLTRPWIIRYSYTPSWRYTPSWSSVGHSHHPVELWAAAHTHAHTLETRHRLIRLIVPLNYEHARHHANSHAQWHTELERTAWVANLEHHTSPHMPTLHWPVKDYCTLLASVTMSDDTPTLAQLAGYRVISAASEVCTTWKV